MTDQNSLITALQSNVEQKSKLIIKLASENIRLRETLKSILESIDKMLKEDGK